MQPKHAFFTVPLAVLRSGKDVPEALGNCLSCGVVNAGIGFRETTQPAAYEAVACKAEDENDAADEPQAMDMDMDMADCPAEVDEEDYEEDWEAALVGARLLGVTGGSRAADLRIHRQHHRAGQVFFRMRAAWLLNAWDTAHQHPAEERREGFKPLTWREFRLIAAVLSAKVNRHGFSFLGWESLQARACGFHSKAAFQAGKAALPPHCQPLSRDIIRREMGKLEALRFFARCRYATGPRGGLTAYSLRHPKRQDLARAIQAWATANHHFQTQAAAHRAADLAFFTAAKAKRQSQQAPPPAA